MMVRGMTDSEVAAAMTSRRYPVTRQAVHGFRRRHAAEIMPVLQEIARRIEDAAISHVVNRVWDAQGDYDRLGQVIDARAGDTRYDEPGYATGMMVHQVKSVGGGKNATLIDEYKVDTAVVAERRQLRREVAEVLGQLPREPAATVNVGVLVRYIHGGQK